MQKRNPQPSVTRVKGKAFDAQIAFENLLAEATKTGYYGSVSLTLTVQDGHIQHVRVATERLVR